MPTGVYKRTGKIREILRQAKLKNPVRYWLGKKGENSSGWRGGIENKLPKCIDCSKRLTVLKAKRCVSCLSKTRVGVKLSIERRKKIGEGHKGEKNFRWKGGITPLVLVIRHCFQYRQWRSDCFTRDNYTCQICGLRGGILNADHYPKMFTEIFHENNIKSLEQALECEEFWNINNGRTLCRECHIKFGKRKI